MSDITQAERAAQHAIQHGLPRASLGPDARREYDRITGVEVPDRPAPQAQRPLRSSPQTRARILEMFKRGNRKYALPFEGDRLAMVSFLGGDWEEYGSIVLQMAVLDTLLSIEEKLSALIDDAGSAADS